jgi:metal-sulfur cluster biosynthetic enzyme
MLSETEGAVLRQRVLSELESVVDPCSVTAGAPAGLVSMGLVGPLNIEQKGEGAHVDVTLFVTEPSCMMGAVFQATAEKKLRDLPGVSSVTVGIDRTHIWTPEELTPDYRRRLSERRARQRAHMEALRQGSKQHQGGD